MNKQIIIFLVVLGILVAGMVAYHERTPSPFNSPVFFGPPADEPEPDTGNKPSKMAQPGKAAP